MDGSGNVFFADSNNNAVKEIVAAGGYTTVHTLGSGFNSPIGVAVDRSGNVFVADGGNNRVEMLDFASPLTLSFAATNVNSSDIPQSVSIANIGNATLSALAPGLSISANFEQVAGSGTPADCTATFSLAPGASCNLSLSFLPTVSGPIASSAVLSDNALNGSPATQTIPLLGTGIAVTQTIAFNPIPNQVQGTTVSLSASASSGLPVSFTSLTAAVCTVSGTTAILVNPGTCTIQASQPGNAQYAAAMPVNQSFTVTPAASFAITATPPAEVVYRERLGGVILKLQSVKGFNGKVTLSCSGGPAGTKCADLPGTVTVNATAYAISGVLFPANTPDGTYTITGVSGSLTNSRAAKFTVK